MAASKKCGSCDKEVYPSEDQVNADGRIYHRVCCKCHDCGRQLTVMDYKKSSDYLDENFLLCQKHYDERFFLIRSKLKGNWKKSQDGKIIELKYEKPKSESNDPTIPRSEKYEVADKVFLNSNYIEETNQFEVRLESERDEALLIDLDLSECTNLTPVDGSSLNRGRFKLNPGQQSEPIILSRPSAEGAYYINASVKVDTVELEALEKPDEPLETTHEIAENVTMVSRLNAEKKQYELFIENNREEPLTFQLDFSGSKNIKIVEEPETHDLHTFLSAQPGSKSDVLVLKKDDEEKDHEFALDVFVHPERKLMIKRWESSSTLYILDERVEIDENVFLVSRFTNPDVQGQQQFIFQIENNTDGEVAVEMNLEGSENVNAPSVHDFAAHSGAVSSNLILQKVDHEAEHNIVLNFTVKHISADGVITRIHSGSSKTSAVSSPVPEIRKTPAVSSGIAGAASAFNKSSFVPNPMAKLGTSDGVSVKYFGSQRFTMVAKK